MDNFPNLDCLIDMALEEDLQDNGDITSESIFSDEEHTFVLVSKDNGILCGAEAFTRVMKRLDSRTNVKFFFSDGNYIKQGDPVAELSGKVISILKAERSALNFLSMLSAVATRTSEFVREAGGRAVILDTRKTLPGFRHLQKYAVRCGGGINHRMGLYDMVMIKDNHIDAAGGISAAVKKVRNRWGDRFKIEIETRNISEVTEALNCGVNRIMLDNMGREEVAVAVKQIGGVCETEASGNMTPEKTKNVSLTGVDFISAGALTNSIKAFDFSLNDLSKGLK